jgi:uncharacterized protein YkwD
MDWDLFARYFDIGFSTIFRIIKMLVVVLLSCAIIGYLLISNGLVITPVNDKMEASIFFDSNITSSKPEIDIGTLERLVHERINEQRVANNVAPLSYDEKLADIARGHSKDMGENNYFEHITPEGVTPIGRGNQAGYFCRKDYGDRYTVGISENIAYDWLWSRKREVGGFEYQTDWNKPETIAYKLVQRWMDSPPHRENILNATYQNEGIGIYVADDGKVFATENFC